MAERKRAASLVECEVLRDYWDEGNRRRRKGTLLAVPTQEAFEGIETGVLKRVKKVGDAD